MNLPIFAAVCLSIQPTANPLGFLYDLPDGWSVAAAQGAYQVLKRPGQTENEIYIVGGSVELEAKASWDQRLQDEDTTMMKKLGPWQPTGGPQTFDAKGGKGMLMKFAGENAGVRFEGHAWSLLAGRKRYGIVAMFPQEQASARYADFFAIAATLRPDPARKLATNNAHAKTWSERISGFRLTASTASNSNSGSGSAGDSGEHALILLPDGTFQFASRTMTFISAGEFSSSSQSSDEAIGVWSVESNGTQAHLVIAPFGKPKERLALRQSGEFILLEGRAFTKRRL